MGQTANLPQSNQPFSFDDLDKPRLSDYESLRITDQTIIPMPVPVLKINGEMIAVSGDIFTISGASKSGKSAVTGMAIAGALTPGGVVNDGLEGMIIAANDFNKAVLHFDTEQARHKHQYNVRSILKRAQLDTCPPHFLSYNIRQLDIEEYQQVTDDICEAASNDFNGIHSIWIDGGADYVADTNDQERSNEVVKYFESLAIKYDTAVFIIVHTNPGSDKERGHFGSQCQRKSGGILLIKNDGDYSHIEGKMLRYAGANSIPQLTFKYDPEKGYHVGSGVISEDAKAKAIIGRVEQLTKKIFGGQKSYSYNESLGAIMRERACLDRTAKNDFKLMNLHGMILQETDKNWRLNYDYFNKL